MQNTNSFQIYNASAGSGKTFTLVKEYLKILLSSDNAFKFHQILAVTFTNKAAGEMKERVIESLYAFSTKEETPMLSLICAETNLQPSIIFNRSQNVLNAILQNYSAFNITTIDSFTHKLIRTFAYDLDLPLNSDVEMDTESLLNEAVDIVISKIGDDQKLTDLLVNFVIQKLDDDKSWDITLDLKNFAKIILNETDANHLKSLNKVSIEAFKTLKENLQKENKNIEAAFKEIGNKGLEIIDNSGVEKNEFAYTGEMPNHFIKLKDLKIADLNFEGRLDKTIAQNKNFYAAKCSASSKQIIEGIGQELTALYYQSKNVYNEFYSQYILNQLIVDSIIPLAVLNYINNALQELKKENNILLNAEFNQLISDTIKDEPAPFIYERIGEKFRYYFIDEMQDTSVLQWQNLIPLIENAITSENEMGESGKLLLVGDAKQSIYRWRGGKAEQFIGLSAKENNANPFLVHEKVENLETNFRSFSEVINFNNSFFTHISKFLTNPNFSNLYVEGNCQKLNSKQGGYVQLSFVEKEKDDDEKDLVYAKKVLEIIENLDAKFQKNEVCVLVRTKKQGIEVANYLADNNIEIISSETLLLKNSKKVDFIINLLNVIQNPADKEYKVKLLYFLYEFLKIETDKHAFLSAHINLPTNAFFEELKQFSTHFNYDEFIQIPFYESIEYIIRSFHLAPESDSNIQFFLDIIFEYQQKKQVSVGGFLEHWELKKDKLSIVAPEAENAVRIMTIHKAKGLEFPVVIFPYSIDIYHQIQPKVWYPYQQSAVLNSVLINYSEKLNAIGTVGETLFSERKEELELDNFNILYVALTRAVEQLYIITDKNILKSGEENLKHTSGLFINYLKEQHLWDPAQPDYGFGNKERGDFEPKAKSDTISQTNFISNSWKNHQISIVANSSLLWDTEQGNAIIYGNLIHEMLANIKTENDISEVINQYLFKGIITNENKSEIEALIYKVVKHPKLEAYFSQNNVVYNEREILTSENTIIIPDRLVVNNNKVTIIDYKTGKPDDKYARQINGYAYVLKGLGFFVEKKLLVYIDSEITIEEI
ncbi:DNA helicase UvrD [Lutibacter sp. HS1-25]|uniref:UvrD-helicase domain-containing protein n=1 Tax=Lutibacter sp. HS1-25 TaxID=2485000 RepID=UPI0010133442|nr:UvrD-helicase domain-containing protein [Lutibacter sp. HS1-25]RXP64468.1 DNA helicase UvrD [Lutibacter sp. HS1-25]